MPISENRSFASFDGDGVQETFEIPFNYRKKSEIQVFRDGEEESFTFTDPSHILITSPLLNNEILVIQRVTDLSEPAVRFRNSSGWTGAQLNSMVDQLLFSVQESRDTADRGLFIDLTGGYDFQSRPARNLAEPTLPNDAVTKQWAETSMSSNLAQAIAAKNASESIQNDVTSKFNQVSTWHGQVNSWQAQVSDDRLAVADNLMAVTLLHGDVDTWHSDVQGWFGQIDTWQQQVSQDAQQVSTDKNVTEGYRDDSLLFRNEAEQFKNKAEASAEGFPTGGIVMWSGSVATIPSGWFLCDGTNGTPDLRNRFVVGAGGAYGVGDTGGVAEVTLTEAQMPAHSHTGSTNSAGNHTHSVARGAPGGEGAANGTTGSSFDTGVGGAHSHSLTINNTGGGQAHENRPPYYALCFIMKG